MNVCQRRFRFVVFWGSLLCCATVSAQMTPPQLLDPLGAPGTTEELPPVETTAPANEARAAATAVGLDPMLVAQGEVAFKRTCVQCHDAEKSLAKQKSLAGWATTVRRMAEKQGAEIVADDVEPIATYLASLGAPQGPAAANPLPPTLATASSNLSAFGTLSPLWRGGNNNIQNPGFFPDLWLGVSWNDPSSAVSARATACIACHSDGGMGNRIELAEAVIRVDLAKAAGCCRPQLKAAVEAGRFIVPFGAFASQSNPGVYRTVSRPLIFNMGQRVLDGVIGDPVLPMPYADEGALASVAMPLFGNVVASADGYVVNGLQGGADGINFDLSRDYVDNNLRPAGGGRFTVGNQYLRLGSSLMGGQQSPVGFVGPNNANLGYLIFGFDATFHYENLLRIQFEYAMRSTDRVNPAGGGMVSRENVGGYYVESELFLTSYISLLGRFDSQTHNAFDTGRFNVSRITYGLNFTIVGGSLLMINQEQWLLPGGMHQIGVTGVRWAYTF